MARRHGNGVNHIRTACIFRHSVHFYLHVQHVLGPIYVDGAIRTAGRLVMPFTTQHACELNAGVRSHWGEGIRHVPMLARAHPLAHPRIPEAALFTSKFLWSPIRPANLSCVPCFPVPFVRVPGIQGLDCPALPAAQLSASSDRCFTSPPQVPCPVHLGTM